MKSGAVAGYLVGINILGFVLYGINTYLYAHTRDKQIDAVLTVVALLGGSAGIFAYIVLFDRRSVKENMMSRVFLVSVLVIQIVACLFFFGGHADKITFAFWDFFAAHTLLTAYLAVMNAVAFVAFGVDKVSAIKHRRRIRIVTLLGLALAGGSVGALVGMAVFRHKIRKDYFSVGVPLILLMQAVVIFYLMNLK